MLKFLARERMCGLFRGQEEEHRDIHERSSVAERYHSFTQPVWL